MRLAFRFRDEPREVERLGEGTGLMGTGMQCIFHLGYLFILESFASSRISVFLVVRSKGMPFKVP